MSNRYLRVGRLYQMMGGPVWSIKEDQMEQLEIEETRFLSTSTEC
jgi:hypothetical protein